MFHGKNANSQLEGVGMRKFVIRHMYLLMIIPILFVASPLSSPGIILTADFPVLDTSSYAAGKLWVWTEKGSVPALETISRFPIIGAWFVLSLIGISSETISKFMIILGFLLASFSFYLSFLLLFKNRVATDNSSHTRLKIAAILGALFFAYNPWSIERIPHWYLWMGYAVLPLFFITVVLAFREPKKLRYIVSSIFLWSFASATPHMTVFYGIIFLIIFTSFVLRSVVRIRNRRPKLTYAADNPGRLIIQLLIPFLSIFFLYLLVNAYWIYPYVMSTQIRSISPNYLVTEENLELLSRESNFLNTFRLVANWQEQPFDIPEEGSSLYYVWYVASFAAPIFGLAAIALSRKFFRYSIAFFSFLVIGIIISMGTQSPIDYFSPIIDNPTLSKYVWLIRDPDKLSFVIAFTTSFLLGISSHVILERIGDKTEKRTETGYELPESVKREHGFSRVLVSTLFLCLLLGTMCVYIYPVYVFNMFGELRPIALPSEFDKLNNYLSRVDAKKVYFIPYPLDETNWSKNNRVGNIYQTHSVSPSIESSGSIAMAGMGSANYYNYLAKSVIENRSKNLANYIHPLGTSYLIFHNDTWDKGSRTADMQNLDLLKRLNSLEGLRNVHNVGFYNVFKVNSNFNDFDNIPGQFNIIGNDVAVLGGLEAMESLNGLYPFFNSDDASVYFFDQEEGTRQPERIKNSDYLLFGNGHSYYDLLFSLVNQSFIFTPFDSTTNYEPNRLWSKASTMDPDSGYFHPYLEHLKIENWQFDYGNGLAITQAMGSNLTMDLDVTKSGQYELFMRYLEGRKGGEIKIYIDNSVVGKINTRDQNSNSFVWQEVQGDNLNSIFLEEGKHMLAIENVVGFNAINLIGLLPTHTISNLEREISSMVNETKDIYFIEAEAGFINSKGISIEGKRNSHVPFSIRMSDEGNKMANYTASQDYGSESGLNRTFTGQFRVPQNADLFSLYFLAQPQKSGNNNRHDTSESLNEIHENLNLPISNLRVYPAHERYDLYSSDFERKSDSIPLASLRKTMWVPDNEGSLSTMWDAHNPISGNSSLRVNVGQGNTSEWNMITTDLLPIDDKSYYGFSLKISAQNVHQLHSKVIFFDDYKERISYDFVSRGRDGTFEDTYSASIVPPVGAKYLRFEILTRPDSTDSRGYYSIDDMKYEEFTIPEGYFDNEINAQEEKNNVPTLELFPSRLTSLEANETMDFLYDGEGTDNDLDSISDLSQDLGSPNTLIQKTRPIPVKENGLYNYTVAFDGTDWMKPTIEPGNPNVYEQNYDNLTVVPYFSNSSDVVDNSTKYGYNANNGIVLSLSPGAEIYTDFHIIKPSEYSIAIRTSKCDSCTFLTLAIEDKDTNKIVKSESIPLRDAINDHEVGELETTNLGRLGWVYLNDTTYLNSGNYEMRVYSDLNAGNQVDLDSVLIYSNANATEHGKLDTILSSKREPPPAYLDGYRRISPAEYEVEVKNATRSYMLSLAESYDPLWIAREGVESTDDPHKGNPDNHAFQTRSIPLYSIVNGFYINKMGDYILRIEYQPQKWFMQGAVISIISVISILVACIIFGYIHKIITVLKTRVLVYAKKRLGNNNRRYSL
jgi:hypothetical protein